jgi:hypothetical protein
MEPLQFAAQVALYDHEYRFSTAVGVHRIYDRSPFEFFPRKAAEPCCSIDLTNSRSHVSDCISVCKNLDDKSGRNQKKQRE